jgi:hypothetical protein
MKRKALSGRAYRLQRDFWDHGALRFMIFAVVVGSQSSVALADTAQPKKAVASAPKQPAVAKKSGAPSPENVAPKPASKVATRAPITTKPKRQNVAKRGTSTITTVASAPSKTSPPPSTANRTVSPVLYKRADDFCNASTSYSSTGANLDFDANGKALFCVGAQLTYSKPVQVVPKTLPPQSTTAVAIPATSVPSAGRVPATTAYPLPNLTTLATFRGQEVFGWRSGRAD